MQGGAHGALTQDDTPQAHQKAMLQRLNDALTNLHIHTKKLTSAVAVPQVAPPAKIQAALVAPDLLVARQLVVMKHLTRANKKPMRDEFVQWLAERKRPDVEAYLSVHPDMANKLVLANNALAAADAKRKTH